MRIAILGTRGIPNNYGGFEQTAEKLSVLFTEAGHAVSVYNPDDHPYPGPAWRGVAIHRVPCGERRLRLGIWGVLRYDYLSLRHALASPADVVLELGYVPSGAFFGLRRSARPRLVTNMDGLEWKRAKWNAVLKRFVRRCERAAVQYSDALIADNPGIQQYLRERFGRESAHIPYGAELSGTYPTAPLDRYGLEPRRFYLLVARLEPENNVAMVLDGYRASRSSWPFVVVGGTAHRYARHLAERYRDPRIRFLGPLYQPAVLDALRHHAGLYFHGHSVGGTNPALLEAMASGALIAAYDCVFNREVLGAEGFFFDSAAQVTALLGTDLERRRTAWEAGNRDKIRKTYNWEAVAAQYLEVLAATAG
ncbi:MAG TPA: DUF1972 domain-containing protein [Gemmatimonadales bacterium]|nr:DUF1972 domain-containing protein [Gemmatimonadales bacterium]